MFKKIILLYHTIKPLKLTQIGYRLRYKFFPLKKMVDDSAPFLAWSWIWSGPEGNSSSFLDENNVIFLNKKVDISNECSWNNSRYEKLWLYNLHYFDDLNAIDSLSRKEIQYHLVKRWISENPPVHGNGWEPYPLSLRIINWIKWYQRSEILDPLVVDSIALQSKALSKQLEYHILGNHLFSNAKALVFSGCFLKGLEGKKYLSVGLNLLDKEIPEQFLADGGHFELSPMYHCILLWDLLDLINLANITGEKFLLERLSSWKAYAVRALSWLNVMTHTDGEISFFNDATIGISASPSQLKGYAKALSLYADDEESECQLLNKTGYTRVRFPDYSLLFDHGDVGPSYLPGHAHADSLSVELSLHMYRVFVNSGTSLYGLSEERHRQRSTAAHNTVVIDDSDSSEVWGGFRVARRAQVSKYQSNIENGLITVSAEHDGYLRLNGGVIHQRKIIASSASLSILDNVSGRYASAVASYHVHPDVNIKVLSKNCLALIISDGSCILFSSKATIYIEESTYHPGFGISIPNKRLVIPIENGTFSVLIEFNKG